MHIFFQLKVYTNLLNHYLDLKEKLIFPNLSQ